MILRGMGAGDPGWSWTATADAAGKLLSTPALTEAAAGLFGSRPKTVVVQQPASSGVAGIPTAALVVGGIVGAVLLVKAMKG